LPKLYQPGLKLPWPQIPANFLFGKLSPAQNKVKVPNFLASHFLNPWKKEEELFPL